MVDYKNILTGVAERLSSLREERPSAGTRYRLMGVLADIMEAVEMLSKEVLDRVSQEAAQCQCVRQLPDIQPIYGSMPSGTLCRMDSQLCPAVGIKCTFAIEACDWTTRERSVAFFLFSLFHLCQKGSEVFCLAIGNAIDFWFFNRKIASYFCAANKLHRDLWLTATFWAPW